ncbi:11148_t:CDS:2, partial [Dentiscutata heterogama]
MNFETRHHLNRLAFCGNYLIYILDFFLDNYSLEIAFKMVLPHKSPHILILLLNILFTVFSIAQKYPRQTPAPTKSYTTSAATTSPPLKSEIPVALKKTTFSITISPTETPSPQSASCQVKITNPHTNDTLRPGDNIDVSWKLAGKECLVDGIVPQHQVSAILFANLTRGEEWKWDYRQNLYHETNTNISSFRYPVQIILSQNIRNLSLFFLDIELTFPTNSVGIIWDVMGPFTILPIPEAPPQNGSNPDNDIHGEDIFASWNKDNDNTEQNNSKQKSNKEEI